MRLVRCPLPMVAGTASLLNLQVQPLLDSAPRPEHWDVLPSWGIKVPLDLLSPCCSASALRPGPAPLPQWLMEEPGPAHGSGSQPRDPVSSHHNLLAPRACCYFPGLLPALPPPPPCFPAKLPRSSQGLQTNSRNKPPFPQGITARCFPAAPFCSQLPPYTGPAWSFPADLHPPLGFIWPWLSSRCNVQGSSA